MMYAYVEEKEKAEVERIVDKFIESGIIKKVLGIERYIHHISRKTKEPIYWYRCRCELNE